MAGDGAKYTKENVFDIVKTGKFEDLKDVCKQKRELLYTKDKDSNQPIHIAASSGHLDIVKRILKEDGKFLHETNMHGQTPLHCAAVQNRIDIVSYLLNNGANPNVKDKYQRTVLHLAIHAQCSLACISELLNDENTEFNTKDENGKSLLYTAAEMGLKKVCERLIKHMKVSEINKDKENVLFAVVRNLKGKDAKIMIQYLYEWTEDEDKEKILHQKNNKGCDILAVAREYKNEDVIEFLKTQKLKFKDIVSVHEDDKLDQVKLYLLGSENFGKTTLNETLSGKQRSLLEMLPICKNSIQNKTKPIINIQTCCIPDAGRFSVWDIRGKPEYLTPPLFTDVRNSVTLLVYKLVPELNENQAVFTQILDWLRFVKSCDPNGQSNKKPTGPRPTVILAAAHSDDLAALKAQQIVTNWREQFKDWLNILDVVIVIDVRKSYDSEGMKSLINTLRAERNSILRKMEGNVPKACLEISAYLAMCKDKFPVKKWSEFIDLIRSEVDQDIIDEEQLKEATEYLQQTGQICVLKDANSVRVIVLSPEWLCNKLLGHLLSPDLIIQRAEEDRYTKHEIFVLFNDFVTNTDELIKLLVNYEFCYKIKKDDEEHAKLLIPCKLPAKMPSDVWKLSMTNPETEIVSYARRISCKNMLDRFPSSFFPNVQTFLVVMSEKSGRKLKLWRNGLKGSDEKVDFIIQMSPSLQAVTISVQVTLKLVCKFQIENQQRLEKCHKVLLTLIKQVNDTKAKTCPETHTCLEYVSGECLKACEDPSEITEVYSQDELIKAEENNNGLVSGKSSNQDRVDDIFIRGCSREVLVKCKWESSVKWIPTDILIDVATKLDQYLPDGHDYRAFAAAIDLDEKCKSLEGDKCESITIALLDEWSKKDEKSTIKELKTILETTPIVNGLSKNRGDVAEVLGKLDESFG